MDRPNQDQSPAAVERETPRHGYQGDRFAPPPAAACPRP